MKWYERPLGVVGCWIGLGVAGGLFTAAWVILIIRAAQVVW